MRYSCNGSVNRLNWCRVVVSCNCHNIRDSQDWTPSNSKFHGWFLPNAIHLKGEQEFGIISSFHFKFCFFHGFIFHNKCTCNSCIVFSSNFVLKISFVIFSCNSSRCSGLKPDGLLSARGGDGVDVLLVVVVSFWSDFSSSSFGGTEITPRCERFRSFSRISMNCCENLKWATKMKHLIRNQWFELVVAV